MKIQMLAVLKTWTFSISQNALHCLLLHPLRIVFVFFALDHSPCARMLWIPTTNLILLRRLQWRNVEALLVEGNQQVSPFYRTSQLAHSEDFWISCLVFTRLSDAVDDRADGALSLFRAIKLIIGLDFAVTLSSPDSFCVLFDITSEHSAELKWLMLDKHKRWFHSSRLKFSLVSMYANWFLVWIYIWFECGCVQSLFLEPNITVQEWHQRRTATNTKLKNNCHNWKTD